MLTFFKKTVIALIFFLFFNSQVKAQWVTISDTNFVAYLQQNYPTCMNGNLMDTTCSGIIVAINVNCSYQNIQDFDGIQYFDSLKVLTCSNNQLSFLPSLPTQLTNLDCSFNNITTISTLPNSLSYLNCNFNNIASLPALPSSLTTLTCHVNNLDSIPPLPSSLIYLACSGNNLTSLPTLPDSMTALNCNSNHLTSLPTLPSSLTGLVCSQNNLSSLPALPNTITLLECNSNGLISLPNIPSKLTQLICYSNYLTSLPALPDTLKDLYCYANNLTLLPLLPDSLSILDCYGNSLTSLPQLPTSLDILNCDYNNLTSLPNLPNSLYGLRCNNNQITCLPKLPNSLINSDNTYLNLSSNPFTCLPNYVPAMNGTAYLNYPLCSENDSITNPNGCIGFKGIYGNSFNDSNSDCLFNAVDSPVKNIPIELYDSANIQLNIFYTLSNGVYNFVLDTAVYTVKIDTTNKPYTVNCLLPGVDSTITLTTANSLAKNVNFEIACKPGFDLGVKSVSTYRAVFPGAPYKLSIAAGDLSKWYGLNCVNSVGGIVVVIVNGPVTFDSIPSGALAPTTIAGNTFTYTIADFGALNLNAFALWFTTDTSALAGDQVCVDVNITPTVGDNDTTNNNYTYCYEVVNSYDPNDKQVYPTTVNPAYNGYFIYTINFQNLGTAAAQNIRVVDTLASNLDLSTFEIIKYSHANTSTLTGNVATFRFPNIQLADSGSDPEGSKGFIQYRIKPVANLPLGTQIKNKARIYFDFNAPILTNTAVSTYNNTVGFSTNTSSSDSEVMVYPNPGKGIFNLRFSGNSASTKTIEVFNLIGDKVFSGGAKAGNAVIDLANKPYGVYVLRVSDTSNIFTQRIVKQ